jgi:hypothetical protein
VVGKRLLGLITAVSSALVVGAVAASGSPAKVTSAQYDRTPVRLGQLKPDQWGTAATSADAGVRDRYPKGKDFYCVGVIMTGQPLSSSTWLNGITRYWDKFFCHLTLSPNSGLQMIFDPKGKNTSIVYRVKPWTPSTSSTGRAPSPSGGGGSGSVGAIHRGDWFRITSARIGSDRRATVNWYLPPDNDSEAYSDVDWMLDGTVQHEYGQSEWRRTELTTRPLTPGHHVVTVDILYIFWTDHYYSTADCDISRRDDYFYVCDWDDTSSVDLYIR